MKNLPLLAISATIALSLSACGGGGAKVSTQTHTTTVGQELLDLDKAYQGGLISEKEYEKTRKNIMSRK